MDKFHLKTLVAILILVLISCNEQPQLSNSTWAGSELDGNYFELNIKIYQDTLFSFVHDDVNGFRPSSSIAIESYNRSLCLDSYQCYLRFEPLNNQVGILHTSQSNFDLVKILDFVDIDSFSHHDCIVRYALRRSKYFNTEQCDTIIINTVRN